MEQGTVTTFRERPKVGQPVTYTFEKLPVELVANIFELTIGDTTLEILCDDRNPFEKEWRHRFGNAVTLSHVSQAWRRLALGSPSLWTFIYLNLTVIERNAIANYWENILPRLGTRPTNLQIFNITMEVYRNGIRCEDGTLNPVPFHAIPKLGYLHLQFQNEGDVVEHRLLEPLRSLSTPLSTLGFDWGTSMYKRGVEMQFDANDILQQFPDLSCISIHWTDLRWSINDQVYTSITKIEFYEVYFETTTLSEIVSACLNLRQLTYILHGVDETMDPPISHRQLESVIVYAIEHTGWAINGPVYHSDEVPFPSLVELRLGKVTEDLPSFIRRHPQVQTVWVKATPYPASTFANDIQN